jgi:tetratricopeptide (TPR) repeat protein
MKDTNGTDSGFSTQFAKALKAGQKRDYKKAIVLLEALAAQGFAEGNAGCGQPDCREPHPEIYLYLARSWHAEKAFARAAVCARSYIALRPEDGSGWFFLGRSWLSDGKYDRALYALRKSIELKPDSVDARAMLGMALLKSRKPVQAREAFEEGLSIAPDDARLNQGYLNALFVEAVRIFKRGDAETARQMLTFLINNDIDGVVPRLYLAHALRELGYLGEALGQYEAAMEFAPDDVSLRWYSVSVLLAMGENEQAAVLMSELGEDPSSVPESPEAVNLFIIKTHLENGEWAAAAQGARSWLKEKGSDPRFHTLMGEAQRNLGNPEQAVNHFRLALQLEPEDPGPRYGILMVLLSSRNWSELRAELVRAERAGCDAETIRYYRVLCEANLDSDPSKILPAIQEQVRIHGGAPELLLALARTYFRLGLADLAIGWYRKVTELDAGNEEAWLGYIASCETEAPDQPLGEAYRTYLEKWSDNRAIRDEYIAYLSAHELWEEAADQAEMLLALDHSVSDERRLALWRRKAGQYRQAAVLYRNMLRKKADDRSLLANLVFCLDKMGEGKMARTLMHEANRILKPDADALLIEGRLCLRAGDFNAALAVYRLAIDRFPDHVRGWEEVAAVYELQGVSEMATVYRQKAREIQQRLEQRTKKTIRRKA